MEKHDQMDPKSTGLTREQVSAWKVAWMTEADTPISAIRDAALQKVAIADAALLSLESRERITELEGALRNWLRAEDALARTLRSNPAPSLAELERATARADDTKQAARSALPEEPK
jgi:hypothetical protein